MLLPVLYPRVALNTVLPMLYTGLTIALDTGFTVYAFLRRSCISMCIILLLIRVFMLLATYSPRFAREREFLDIITGGWEIYTLSAH